MLLIQAYSNKMLPSLMQKKETFGAEQVKEVRIARRKVTSIWNKATRVYCRYVAFIHFVLLDFQPPPLGSKASIWLLLSSS